MTIPRDACSMHTLQSVTLSRDKIVKMLDSPALEAIEGLRQILDYEKQVCHFKNRWNRKGRRKRYDVCYTKRSTDIYLLLKDERKVGSDPKPCSVNKISNQHIAPRDFERWQKQLAQAGILPKENDIRILNTKIQNDMHRITHDAGLVHEQVKERQAKRLREGKRAVNATREKMERKRKLKVALQELERAKQSGDANAISVSQVKLNKLQSDIKIYEAQLAERAAKASYVAASINSRNEKQSLDRMKQSDAQRAKDRSNPTANPWMRAPTRPVNLWQTSRKKTPEADSKTKPVEDTKEKEKEKKDESAKSTGGVRASPRKARKMIRHVSSVENIGKKFEGSFPSPRSGSQLQRRESNLHQSVKLSVLGSGGVVESPAAKKAQVQSSKPPNGSGAKAPTKTMSLQEYMARKRASR